MHMEGTLAQDGLSGNNEAETQVAGTRGREGLGASGRAKAWRREGSASSSLSPLRRHAVERVGRRGGQGPFPAVVNWAMAWTDLSKGRWECSDFLSLGDQ